MTRPGLRPTADVERVLVVTAHPDDVDYGASASVAAWTDAGVEVSYCIATFGDAGGFDETPRERMPLLREAEQRAAAKVVGVTDVTFLGPLTRYEVSVGEGLRLVVQTQTESEDHFARSDRVSLSWPPSAPVVLKD